MQLVPSKICTLENYIIHQLSTSVFYAFLRNSVCTLRNKTKQRAFAQWKRALPSTWSHENSRKSALLRTKFCTGIHLKKGSLKVHTFKKFATAHSAAKFFYIFSATLHAVQHGLCTSSLLPTPMRCMCEELGGEVFKSAHFSCTRQHFCYVYTEVPFSLPQNRQCSAGPSQII